MGESGSLGHIGVMTIQDVNQGTTRLSVSADVMQKFQANGFGAPAQLTNGFRGDLPADITALSDDELGDLLNNLSQYQAFVEFKLAEAELERDEAERQKEFIRARVRLNVKGSGERLTGPDKNDYVETDDRVLAAERKVLYTNGFYDMLKVVRNNVQKNWETVSRRITQRGQAIERQVRGNNVNNVPAPLIHRQWGPR
jgi:hypothetical protein